MPNGRPSAAMPRRHLGAAGGLVFAVLSVVGLAVTPKPPKPGASAATVRHYVAAHLGGLRAGVALSALAALAMLPFFAALRSRLPGAAGDTLLAAGVVPVAAGVFGSVLEGGLVLEQHRLSDDGLLVLFTVARVMFFVAPALGMIIVAGAAAAAYRGRLPDWLAAGSALLALVALVGGIGALVSYNDAAGGIGLAGFILTILWAGSSAVVLLTEKVPDSAAREART